MFILESKLADKLWKQYLIFQYIGKSKLKLYEPETKIERFIYDSIINLTYENIPDYNTEAIYKYIQILEKIINDKYTLDKDKKKALNLIDRLILIDTYYIVKRKLYPQITISKRNIYRFYYYPFFNMNIKHILNLFKFNFVSSEYKVYYFDINAALIRTFFYYLHKKTNSNIFYDLYTYEDDLYEALSEKFNIKVKRKQFKKDIVSLLIGKRKYLPVFIRKYQEDLTKNSFINAIINFMLSMDNYKLTILHHYLLFETLNNVNEISNLPFFNYDGGIILSKNDIIDKFPRYYRIEQVISNGKER